MSRHLPTLLVLTSTYPRWPGDPEPAFVHALARRLTDRFRVVVLAPHAPGAGRREVMDGVHVHRYRYAPQSWQTLVNDGGVMANLKRSPWKLALVPPFIAAQAWAAWRLCRKEGVSVVHAHWLIPQGLVAALLGRLPGCRAPFLVTSHGADLYALKGQVLRLVMRWVARRADSITVVSRAMSDDIAWLDVDPEKVGVLPMGVDFTDLFRPEAVPRLSTELLFVGRLVEKKGLRHLIDAMPRILSRFPEARLTVAGFGPEAPALKEQVAALALEGVVTLLGAVPQDQLPALYRRAAVFVAPFVEAKHGDREGLGLVTLEAIGCGCPVIVGDVPAVRDVLDDGMAGGMRVQPGDAAALSEAVIRALENPQRAMEDALRLRDRLVARFDWQAVAAAYADLLLETAGLRHES